MYPWIRARRRRRLRKIAAAKLELENALLELYPRLSQARNETFQAVYYLEALAKKAPWGGGPVE